MLFNKKKKEIVPDVYSEDTCNSCGERTKRSFREGDYVYGRGDQCKKCSSTDTLVTAVYGEYPPEEKR